VQGVRRNRELVARAQLDLTVAVDPEHDTAAAAAERLLLARVVAHRRMAVLGAHLSREEDELLRAHALGVHVDDELKADLDESAEPEVRDLDLLLLCRRQDDARVREHRRRAGPGLGFRHSATGALVAADVCSASSARA
jgi:hypothetical protein